ncbi:MAG: hypothetical protein HW412_151 [Bacteroidetes bacterium]|nr:hypothetical protein [Bacteroidota bacterium]
MMSVRKAVVWILWCTAFTVPTAEMVAQYYEEKEYAPSEARYVALGFLARDFTPRSSNALADSLVIRYTRVMPIVSFRQGAGELMFGYARYTLAGSSKSTIFFGGRFGTEVPLAGRKASQLLFPLQLAVDYTKAEGIGPSKENFNIASIGIGMGLKYRHFTSSVDFSIGVEELVQFSTDGFGVGNGFSSASIGDVVLLLHDVALLDGIAVGYRFRFQTWAMNESKFNYRSISHGPYLGVIF